MKNDHIKMLSLIYFLFVRFSRLELVQIIEPREKAMGLKIDYEAELSFVTEELGFVNDEYLQRNTPWESFLSLYSDFKTGHEAYIVKITKRYLTTNKLDLCTAYLSDQIFRDSRIFFSGLSLNDDIYELNHIHFEYFSNRKVRQIKTIRCPVIVNGQKTYLYFQEIRYPWTNKMGYHRGYFVFKKRKIFDTMTLEILMYTAYNLKPLPRLDEAGDEAESIDGRNNEMRDVWMNLKIQNVEERRYRALAIDAEMLFQMSTYGVIDFMSEPSEVERILKTVEQMREGYEIDHSRMFKPRTGTETEICDNYIMKNLQLMQNIIIPDKTAPEKDAKWIQKRVRFTESGILPNGRDRQLLQCPVTFDEEREKGFVYILPIHYENFQKLPQLFTFTNFEQNSDEVRPILLSTVRDTIYKHSDRVVAKHEAVQTKEDEKPQEKPLKTVDVFETRDKASKSQN